MPVIFCPKSLPILVILLELLTCPCLFRAETVKDGSGSLQGSSKAALGPLQSDTPETTSLLYPLLLILDVDNTLYENDQIVNIESQIVHNIHKFCQDRFNLSQAQADALHHTYGSTIEGLRQTRFWTDSKKKTSKKQAKKMHQMLQDFYHDVYHNVSVTCLLQPASPRTSVATSNTGYSHSAHDVTKSILSTLPRDISLYLASNSPLLHVYKIIQALGLTRIPWKSIWTPDSNRPWQRQQATKNPDEKTDSIITTKSTSEILDFPTKAHATAFFDPALLTLLERSLPQESSSTAATTSNYRPLSAETASMSTVTKTISAFLLDDSITVLKQVTQQIPAIRGISVTSSASSQSSTSSRKEQQQAQYNHQSPLFLALAVALGWITPQSIAVTSSLRTVTAGQLDTNGAQGTTTMAPLSSSSSSVSSLTYSFDAVQYLRHKNKVDVASIHAETWNRLGFELSSLLLRRNNVTTGLSPPLSSSASSSASLCIVDLGAGILSMLKLMLYGSTVFHDDTAGATTAMDRNADDTDENEGDKEEGETPRLVPLVSFLPKETKRIDYYAYEPNLTLEEPCLQVLRELGFEENWGNVLHGYNNPPVEHVMERRIGRLRVVVHLRMWDFDRNDEESVSAARGQEYLNPDLIVGCCFADLLDPVELTKSLLRRFSSKASIDVHGQDLLLPLVYFPITFSGVTQVLPPLPAEENDVMIPSDTAAFRFYSKALAQQGHQLDPDRLINVIADYGGKCLARGPSDWSIDPAAHEYLWETMIYFFGTVAAPELCAARWNAHAWLHRVRKNRPVIHVSNVDLLFQLPYLGQWRPSEEPDPLNEAQVYQEIQFTAPNSVTNLRKISRPLKPRELRIQSVASLISSGTELKVFKGLFEDAALDVNIKGMSDERMAFPLAYGYSLVGRVVACGSAVHHASDLLGKLVFVFAPHASQAVVDRDSIQIVPDGIDPMDAIFMPAVETALSLVQDANPRYGEKVVVFGQGLVGLLVTAILSRMSPTIELSSATKTLLTTVDTVPSRLAASIVVGSSQALMPAQVSHAGPFDIAIEVSGNSRALQSAIDATREGGLVIIGSWYGSSKLELKLDMDFHRSHKTLRAAQVSRVPAAQTATWTKERRFEVTWDLVRQLRPSRLITRRTTLDNAQKAYSALENGSELAIAFEYD